MYCSAEMSDGTADPTGGPLYNQGGGSVGNSYQGPITLVSGSPKKSAVPLAFAALLYQKLMWYVNQYRENAAASSPARLANGDYTPSR
ncbi:hypothetical protein AS200_03760 [Streptomyces sp. CdTB01]|nr:hypothetical protein AS200_03760 [Streptomyces sp. CdTB01]